MFLKQKNVVFSTRQWKMLNSLGVAHTPSWGKQLIAVIGALFPPLQPVNLFLALSSKAFSPPLPAQSKVRQVERNTAEKLNYI